MCHQSVGLVQHAMERAGMATVSISLRPEITAHMNVARAAYVRFPLGNPFGEVHAPGQHERILGDLLALVEEAREPLFVELPYRWRRMPRE
jgi:hypothetical protein